MAFNRNYTRTNIFTWLWPASLVTVRNRHRRASIPHGSRRSGRVHSPNSSSSSSNLTSRWYCCYEKDSSCDGRQDSIEYLILLFKGTRATSRVFCFWPKVKYFFGKVEIKGVVCARHKARFGCHRPTRSWVSRWRPAVRASGRRTCREPCPRGLVRGRIIWVALAESESRLGGPYALDDAHLTKCLRSHQLWN